MLFLPLAAIVFFKTVSASIDAGHDVHSLSFDPKIFGLLSYTTDMIPIWKHISKAKFYIQPLAQLKPDSARIQHSPLSKKVLLLFDVRMHSKHMRKEAAAVIVSSNATAYQHVSWRDVTQLLNTHVRIFWDERRRPPSKAFHLMDHWISTRSENITFRFKCDSYAVCEFLRQEMQTRPESFDGLRLMYKISASSTSRRKVEIKTDQVLNGNLMSRLATKFHDKSHAYVSTSDLTEISNEAASNIVSKVFEDADYESPADQSDISELIMDAIASHERSSETFTTEQWKSVFWQDDMARPDKVVEYLSKVFYKNQSDEENLYINKTARERLVEVGVGAKAGVEGIAESEWSTNAKTENKDMDKIKKHDIMNRLGISDKNVAWTGEKFQVKPMKLHRVNLRKLRRSTVLNSKHLLVRKFKNSPTLSVGVPFPDFSQYRLVLPYLMCKNISEDLSVSPKFKQLYSMNSNTELRNYEGCGPRQLKSLVTVLREEYEYCHSCSGGRIDGTSINISSIMKGIDARNSAPYSIDRFARYTAKDVADFIIRVAVQKMTDEEVFF